MKEKFSRKLVQDQQSRINLRKAFEEVWVYPFAVIGVFCAPILSAATEGIAPKLVFDWTAFVIALVITAAMVVISEMRGTREQKRVSRIRLSRYAFSFLLGLFWRLVVPLIQQTLLNIFSSTAGV